MKSPPARNRSSVRAADRSFFANLFASLAEEMGVTLGRTAFSPNIKERQDYSCALFDAEGRMIAQAAHIPVHLGAMPLSVNAALEACGPLRAGDLVLLNDPFQGGTHLPDITMISPVVDGRGRRQALLATRAHHADVGGMTPGSLPPSTEICQEGLRIPPVKLVERGRENRGIRAMLLANVRTPREREGDLRAQQAAHEVGETRFREALDRYGAATLRAQMTDLRVYAQSLMERIIERIPDGDYDFADTLDAPDAGRAPTVIRARVSIRGDRAIVDFAGTDPATTSSLNAVLAITRSAVDYCFLCLLCTPSELTADAPPSPPLNAGCFAPIRVRAPEGCLVNAAWPHAVAGGNVETSQRIVDVVFGALAQALPGVVPAASQGTMNNLTLGGLDPRSGLPFAYYETVGGGGGALPDAPGPDAVQVHMTNTLNTPVEALEFAYPIRVESYRIRTGSGGKGHHRGGHGIERSLRLLSDTRGALLSQRRNDGPYGLQGGAPGATGIHILIRGRKRTVLPPSCSLDLRPGDVLQLRTPGGGGFGAP